MSEEALPEEEDIWEYRSIRKQKLQCQNDAGDYTQTEQNTHNRKSKSKRSPRNKTESISKNAEKTKKNVQLQTLCSIPAITPENNPLVANWSQIMKSQNYTKSPAKQCTTKQSPQIMRPVHDGHCPNCQMPFSILSVQSPRWHVDECLDAKEYAEKECPEGLQCSSTIPSHYKRFTHFQLARSRAGTSLTCDDVTSDEVTLTCSGAATINTSDGGVIGNVQPPLPTPEDISYSPFASDEEGDTEGNRNPSEDGHGEKEGGFLAPSASRREQRNCGLNGPQGTGGECTLEVGVHPRKEGSRACHDGRGAKRACAASQTERTVHIKQEPHWPGPGSPVSNDGEGGRKGPEPASWLHSALPGSAAPLAEKVKWEEEMPVQSMLSSPFQASQSYFNFEKEACGSRPVFSVSPSQSGAVKEEESHCNAERLLNLHVKKVRSVCVNPNAKAALPKALKQTDIGVFFGLQPKEEKGPEGSLSQRSTSVTTGGTPKGNRAGQRKRKAGGSVADTDAVPVAPPSKEVSPKITGRGQQGWPKRFREADGTDGERGKKQCPFYKKIPGTGFTVDAFQFGNIEGCTAYFLTHFHSDHYGGLTKKFQCPIYCSKITGNLVRSKLRVEEHFIHTLPMDTECMVEGVKVVLLEANHCPGAVLLLFCLPNGSAILHTGDFRADPSMEQYPALIGRKIHTLYLDTTYCSPEYTFPPQQEAIQFAATTAFEIVTLYPRTMVVCGTYSVGKEKVFLAIAGVLGCKVCMSQDKYKTLQCLESKEISSQITTDWNSTSLHVLPMMQVNFKGLLSHLNKFSGQYDRVLAFKPTGWTYSDGCASVADIKPTVRGKITMYGIPYSEHSSYLEMKRFVQWLGPQKIIPTVNMGNWKTRTTMEKYFSQWMTEPTPKRGINS